jgi:hypothetical protein
MVHEGDVWGNVLDSAHMPGPLCSADAINLKISASNNVSLAIS